MRASIFLESVCGHSIASIRSLAYSFVCRVVRPCVRFLDTFVGTFRSMQRVNDDEKKNFKGKSRCRATHVSHKYPRCERAIQGSLYLKKVFVCASSKFRGSWGDKNESAPQISKPVLIKSYCKSSYPIVKYNSPWHSSSAGQQHRFYVAQWSPGSCSLGRSPF